MKRRIVIAFLILFIAGFVIAGVIIDGSIIERLLPDEDHAASVETIPSTQRIVDVHDVVAFLGMTAPMFRIHTATDVIPGGYAAAMVPILVDWGSSDFGKGGEIIIRNINDGGNPVSGVTMLRSAILRPDKVIGVEFILVPLGGVKAFSHGQLRFVFDKGGAEYFGGDLAVGEPEALEDLVLSWEAWRPPGDDFSVMKGMDSRNYELSLRGFSGPQRFLEDALGARDWTAYTLRLPGGSAGFAELLKVSLMLGDGAARYSISWMFESTEQEWTINGPDSEDVNEETMLLWRGLREQAQKVTASDKDPRLDLVGKTGYQTLLRSCATMALYCIDVTVVRLIEQGYPNMGMHPSRKPEIENEPDWMAHLADSDIGGIFVQAPKIIGFARTYPAANPTKIPNALDDAGLLLHENGMPVKRRYSMDTETPWGRLDQLLIR